MPIKCNGGIIHTPKQTCVKITCKAPIKKINTQLNGQVCKPAHAYKPISGGINVGFNF